VRGVGLEPTKAFATGASVLLLRPISDIPADTLSLNWLFIINVLELFAVSTLFVCVFLSASFLH
jgi:hypothetical protein